MLTDKVIALAKEYEETLRASADDPTTLIGARKQYIDFLFDEILSNKNVFDSFSIMGTTEHGENEIILKYSSESAIGHVLRKESGIISHYQFAAFQHDHTDFLLLRDDATSHVKLYVMSSSVYREEKGNPQIGTNGDLTLSCRVKGAHHFTGKTVRYDEPRDLSVREVGREELINPQSCNGYYKHEWTKGRLFDACYYGLSRFTDKCRAELEPLKGNTAPSDINKAYQALQSLAGRL